MKWKPADHSELIKLQLPYPWAASLVSSNHVFAGITKGTDAEHSYGHIMSHFCLDRF